MITKEILQVFCSDYRDNLKTPWTSDGCTYATDGRVLIRVPEMQEIPHRNDAPSNLASLGIKYEEEMNGLHPIPDLPAPITEPCDECDDGFIEHEDCPHCTGHKCEYCDGIGNVDKQQPVKVGTRTFDARLLRQINALPNLRIEHEGDELLAAAFAFDGGVGLLMPMRINDI